MFEQVLLNSLWNSQTMTGLLIIYSTLYILMYAKQSAIQLVSPLREFSI